MAANLGVPVASLADPNSLHGRYKTSTSSLSTTPPTSASVINPSAAAYASDPAAWSAAAAHAAAAAAANPNSADPYLHQNGLVAGSESALVAGGSYASTESHPDAVANSSTATPPHKPSDSNEPDEDSENPNSATTSTNKKQNPLGSDNNSSSSNLQVSWFSVTFS